MGRPRKEDYRKKLMRFSKVEDSFRSVIDTMESDRDKKILLQALEKLKA